MITKKHFKQNKVRRALSVAYNVDRNFVPTEWVETYRNILKAA